MSRSSNLPMGSTNFYPGNGYEADGSGTAVKISSEVMVAALIFFFLIVVFVFFVYLYAKHYWSGVSIGQRRAQFIFTPAGAPISSRGLDAAVVRSLPITIYKRSDFKDALECSVCLCELSDGEKARLLPKCNHGFHLECIDMWFQSHCTCPLCRCPVGPEATAAPAVAGEAATTATASADQQPTTESPILPTNVLFWGNHERVNTGAVPQEVNSRSTAHFHRTLVISVPSRTAEGFPSPISPLPLSILPMENMKSPAGEAKSPVPSKFRSLRRLLSRGKRTVGSSCSSPVGGDIEQGMGVLGEGTSSVAKTLPSS
ncbi:hypothetical protein HPP92_015595 [Vanilla planifolia]|uniref:RING-type E3 ubiquitin transferase n=1 Tax=Vanilla planifolia TaxID=51239 RepID=A0A835UPT6_VANPL|nr:hypothetical protein HPP92_016252 [Vanilla planifolia]KAG0471049.1 hypothetical protein HPP92_015595 [Vanilla planifolia]